MFTLVDAHVHVHGTTDAALLLDSALQHFRRQAQAVGAQAWQGALMLAEMRDAAWFESLAARGVTTIGQWKIQQDPQDPTTLMAEAGDVNLFIVAGRQIATSEGLEVLTLGTREKVADGLDVDRTLAAAGATGALVVLPWAVGKWLGRRGDIVRRIASAAPSGLQLGDNGGRPWFWAAPAVMSDRPLLSGSDPLPLAADERRVGSFGFWIDDLPTGPGAGAALREYLRGAGRNAVHPFGRQQGVVKFFGNQVGLRLNKKNKDAAAIPPTTVPDGPETPDVETSSANYASRFTGAAGRYLLQVQSDTIRAAIASLPPGRALDVGGGHGQLVDLLRGLGWEVTVHGTTDECERNLRELHGKRDCAFLRGDLFSLPVADRTYDLVIAVRLISHVNDWPRLLAEMCRVSRRAVVIDYPSTSGLNALTPMLFSLKKSLEGNTRTYTSFSESQLDAEFARNGFARARQVKQFFMPMVVHRVGKANIALRALEKLFRMLGLTHLAGSPVILRADRK